jgi:hypothetical protein
LHIPGGFPGIDLTEQADNTFKHFAEAGMHPVKSTQIIFEWPEFPSIVWVGKIIIEN